MTIVVQNQLRMWILAIQICVHVWRLSWHVILSVRKLTINVNLRYHFKHLYNSKQQTAAQYPVQKCFNDANISMCNDFVAKQVNKLTHIQWKLQVTLYISISTDQKNYQYIDNHASHFEQNKYTTIILFSHLSCKQN